MVYVPNFDLKECPKNNMEKLKGNNIYLTNYGQNAYLWTLLTFSHRGKSRNTTQNVAFWTFLKL
jgi:hypothetical protein